MATTVNLNLGGEGGEGQVYTADLVLTSPYTEPTGNLLVLRSRPDAEHITGALAVTESADRFAAEGVAKRPADPITGTLSVTNAADTASFTGTPRAPARTGTMAVTTAQDTASFTGPGFSGIVARTGTLTVTESRDTATATATYTPKWVATIAATEPGDTAAFDGAFLPYTGPGFLNVTERPDTATAVGRVVYAVSGTLEATESADIAAITARTREVLIAETVDTVIATEELVGDAESNLFDQVIVTDLLDYSRDMAFADTAVASESLLSSLRISTVLSDTAIAADAAQVIYGAATVDQVTVTETLRGDLPFEHNDHLTATDALASQLQLSGVLADTVGATDALTAVWSAVSTDAVTFSDTLDSDLTQGAGLEDVVVIAEVVTGALAVTGVLADTVTATDTVTSAKEAALTETVIVVDAVDSVTFAAAALADTVTVTDVLTGTFTVYAPALADTVTATDALLGGLTLVGVLADTVVAGDVLLTAEAQTVYVVNAETGAVSTYQLTPAITGMAEYRGVLYLSGPDGLYALDAASDGDGDIVWTLRTGFSNLGTDRLKRVQDCNFQARTEGDTTFQVVSDRYGQKQEWNYRLPPLTRDSYRDGVVKVGRGVQSVYWQFAAEGIGPAEIDQLRLVVEPLSRRR